LFIFLCFLFFGEIYIPMGRKPLNKSYEEILEESRERANEYYELNKEEIKKKRMERYNQLKNGGKTLLTENTEPKKQIL
jgi:hypothetical protein